MDIQNIKDMISDEEILDFLGLEYEEKGSRISVLCPFHGDKHLGSAFFKDGYFRCFSCNEYTDIIGLTQQVFNISFADAVKQLAVLAGVGDVFSFTLTDEEKEFNAIRLTKEELELLDFPKTRISLKKVYFTSPELYKEIVLKRANEKLSHYQFILEHYADRSALGAYDIYELYDGKVNAQIYRNIKNETKARIRICNQILERFE